MSDKDPIFDAEPLQKDIFERLLAGEAILTNDPQLGRLRAEAFAVKALLYPDEQCCKSRGNYSDIRHNSG
jgi:hypothetical protein